MTAGSPRRTTDTGAGLLSTLSGFVVVLAFLLFAVQVSVNLYATSVVTSVAFDAARTVATSADPSAPEVRAAAEARARAALGPVGEAAKFDWRADSDEVRLHVSVASSRFLLPGLRDHVGFDTVSRTVDVRVERVR